MAHSHPFFCHSVLRSVMVSEAEPSAPTVIPTGGHTRHVIPTDPASVILSVGRSPKPKDLLHSLTFHRKRNGKPLMLSKTHSLPFHSSFLCSNAGSSRRLSCHLERQSRGLTAKADSSTPVLRTSARNDIATPTSERQKRGGSAGFFPPS